MRRFDRYVLAQLMLLFGLFALILVAVYWVNRAVVLFDRIIADGHSAGVFLELTLLSLPNVIRLVLPVAAFAAAVQVTSRLAADSELLVVQSMGWSQFRLARPVLVFGLIVACLGAALGHVLVPASRAQLADRRAELAESVTAGLLREGRFFHPVDGVSLFIREITPRGELRDIFLADARDPQNRTDYTAQRALLVREDTGPKLVMFDGMAQTYRPADQRLATTRFTDFAYDIGDLVAGGGARQPDPEELATSQLLAAGPEVQAATGASRAALLLEAHTRLAEPVFAVAAALIGFAALMQGGYSRFGVWRQVLLAIALLIVVKFLDNFVAGTVQRDPALWPLVYLPGLAGVALAAGLLWVAGRPGLFRSRTAAP